MHQRKYFALNFFINEIFSVEKFPNYGNWIGHYKDHFGRFSIISAQKQVCSESMKCIEQFDFPFLGVPNLPQLYNRKEFNTVHS